MGSVEWPPEEIAWSGPIEFGEMTYDFIEFSYDVPTLRARMDQAESKNTSEEVSALQERVLEPAEKGSWKVPGAKFGRWEIVGTLYRDTYNKFSLVLCRCECGTVRPVAGMNLMRGVTKSCGCSLYLEPPRRTHGMSGTRIYSQWVCMMERCGNPKNPGWYNYGGRGITVDPRWRNFEQFYGDVGDRPKGKSLDRINNDGPYSKENCKWATRKEQSRNTRRNRLVTIGGITKPLIDWLDYTKLPYGTVLRRIMHGWEPIVALTKPSLMEGL